MNQLVIDIIVIDIQVRTYKLEIRDLIRFKFIRFKYTYVQRHRNNQLWMDLIHFQTIHI